MHVIQSKEEIAATITLAPWKQNVRLRSRFRDDIEQYWSLVREALTRAVDELLEDSEEKATRLEGGKNAQST